MIIEKQKNKEITYEGESESSIKMGIDLENIGLLTEFLSKKIYSDCPGSVARETVSNAVDSHVKANTEDPVLVCLKKNATNNWEFTVEDFGVGIDDKLVNSILSKYLASTKRDDNTQIGAMGIGFKAGTAYNGCFTFIGRKDGVERTWIMYEGEDGNNIDLISTKETTERNGAKIIVAINYYDVRDFSYKIREQLSYFRNVYIIDEYEAFDNSYKIYENELFKWSEMQSDESMHICLDQVYYPLDFKKLKINPINVPVSIKIGLDEGVSPTLSRESLIISPKTKELILGKIKAIAEWFVNEYNKNIVSYESLLKAWDVIDEKRKHIKIGEKEFVINDLLEHSSIPAENIKIKGIDIFSPSFYKANKLNLLKDYHIIGKFDYTGKLLKERASKYMPDLIGANKKPLLLNNNTNVSGFFKDFLKRDKKYGFLVKQQEQYNIPIYDLKWYRKQILNNVSRENWRKAIEEFNIVKKQFINELFEDGTKLHSSQEFKNYIEENKKKGIYKYVSKKLEKSKEDVIIQYVVNKDRGDGYKFERRVEKIATIHQLPYQFIVFCEGEEEECKKWSYDLWNYRHIECVLIKNVYLKKLPKINKFIMYSKAIQKPNEIKLFKQLATSMLFQQEYQLFQNICENATDLIKKTMNDVVSASEKLKSYIKQNNYQGMYNVKEIIQKAFETNDFDYTLWEEYKLVQQFNKEFDFLRWYRKPNEWRDSELEDYQKFVNKMLLMKKLSGKFDLNMFEICAVHDKCIDETEFINNKIENNELV